MQDTIEGEVITEGRFKNKENAEAPGSIDSNPVIQGASNGAREQKRFKRFEEEAAHFIVISHVYA